MCNVHLVRGPWKTDRYAWWLLSSSMRKKITITINMMGTEYQFRNVLSFFIDIFLNILLNEPLNSLSIYCYQWYMIYYEICTLPCSQIRGPRKYSTNSFRFFVSPMLKDRMGKEGQLFVTPVSGGAPPISTLPHVHVCWPPAVIVNTIRFKTLRHG